MKYRIFTGSLHHIDKHVIRLTRYHDDGRAEVLTNDGWREYQEWEEIPVNDLPGFSGADMVNMEKVVNLIADMEDRIKQAINEKEAEDNGTSQTPEQQHEQINADIEEVSGISEYAKGPADEDYYEYRQEYPTAEELAEGTSPAE